MMKKTDPSLLLILSEKEAQALRDIVHAPAEPVGRPSRSKRLLFMLIAILLVAGLSLGLLRSELAATLMKWVALLHIL